MYILALEPSSIYYSKDKMKANSFSYLDFIFCHQTTNAILAAFSKPVLIRHAKMSYSIRQVTTPLKVPLLSLPSGAAVVGLSLKLVAWHCTCSVR
jgi:hypothetical protein